MNRSRSIGALAAGVVVVGMAGCGQISLGHNASVSSAPPTPEMSSKPTPSHSPSAHRPKDIDLSSITKPCKTFKKLNVAKYGFKHDPGLLPSDKTDQGMYKHEFPGARVAKCTWIDGDAGAGKKNTDLVASVGVIDGLGMSDRPSTSPPGTDDKMISVKHYPTYMYHNSHAPTCSGLIDVNDKQMLWVSYGVIGKRSEDFQTFEKACAKLPAFAGGVLSFAANL